MNAHAIKPVIAALCLAAAMGCERDSANESDMPVTPADRTSANDGATTSSTAAPTDSASTPAASSAWTPPADPGQTHFLGLMADKPVTWIEQPPMRPDLEATRFTVPGRDGSPAAEIVVFHGIGGTIEANIDRWRGQFRPNEAGEFPEPMVDTITAGDDMEVTLVELIGDWRKLGAASYTPNQQFITAIINSPSGMVFVRFVGDTATVGPNRNAFLEMMRSLRIE